MTTERKTNKHAINNNSVFLPHQQLKSITEDLNNNLWLHNWKGNVQTLKDLQNYYDASHLSVPISIKCIYMLAWVYFRLNGIMFLICFLQQTLKKLKSFPCIFNLEAKCGFMKNRLRLVLSFL